MKKILSAVLLALAGGVTAGELSCVTFTGKQWVNTGVAVATNVRVVCDFQLLRLPVNDESLAVMGSLAQTPEGLNTGWGLRAHGPTTGYTILRNLWAAWSGNNYIFLTNTPIDTARHTIELKDGWATFDDQVYASDGPARDPATANGGMSPYYVGATPWPGGGVASASPIRFFSIQFYRTIGGAESLVKDFVPYELDGVYGLYDKVNAKFHPALGTEALLAGVWTSAPSVTPSTWNRRAGVTPTINPGTVTNAATVTCSHTAAQLAALPVGSHRVTFTTHSEEAAFDGCTVDVIVTVEEPLAATTANGGATVSLTFPPATEARTLHLVYGTADKGTNLAAWDHCVDVPVPAGTDTLQVNAPAGFGEENPVWSALLKQPATAKNALSYVRHGNLILQWDGEENAAYGQHDANRSFPAEIRHGYVPSATSGSMVAEAKSFTLGNGYFKLDTPVLQTLVNAGHATVEVTLKHDHNDSQNNGGIFSMGNTSRGFWYYQKTDGKKTYYPGDVSYHATMRDQYEVYTSGMSDGTNTIACTLGTSSNYCYLAQNGEKLKVGHSQCGLQGTYKFQRYNQELQDDDLYIGILPGDWFKNGNGPMARARVCSIRVYDQVLSLDEIEANAAVDAVRFRGEDIEQAGPYYAEIPLTVAKVNKENKIPVSTDLVFMGAASERRVYFAWGSRDLGASFAAWPNTALMGTVPAGVTTATLAIPAAARASVAVAGGFRIFLENLVTAASYAQGDHLVAQFDGIENGGFGVHDTSRMAPRELRHDLAITATGKLDVGDKHFRLGAHSFSFACPALQTAINEGHATIELVLATNGVKKVNNGGYFCIGGTVVNTKSLRGFWYYEKIDKQFGDLTYHGKDGDYWLTNASATDGSTNTQTFVLGPTSEESWMEVNGVKWLLGVNSSYSYQLKRCTTDTDDMCFIGVLPGNYLKDNCRPQHFAYSYRLYDCILTDAERALNHAIDRQRFRDEFACATASAYTRGYAGGLTVIIR